MSKTVAVYGATAFSAGPTIEYLLNHPDSADFKLVLAGRNRQKLEKLKSSLSQDVEIAALGLDDHEAVKNFVERADVIINLAGPYSKHGGEALIRACAETGTHYVDLAGEGHWLGKTIVPQYDYLASTTGACIVPSCGFDSVPSDLTVYSALRTLQASHPDLTITKSQSFFKVNGTLSGGTVATMYTLLDIPWSERRSDEWQLVTSYPKPSPRPKAIYEGIVDGVKRTGAFFFMFPFNRLVVRRSWYLSTVNTALFPHPVSKHESEEGYSLRSKDKGKGKGKGKQTGARQSSGGAGNGGVLDEPVHGDEMHYEEAIVMPNKPFAWLFSMTVFSFFALFFTSRIFRFFIDKVIPQPGEGATRDKLEKGWWAVDNVSETTDPNIQVITKLKGSGDPGYLSTCFMLAESALALVLTPPEGTALPPLAGLGGVLTPATAMGQVLVERLRKSGKFEFESRVVEKSRGNKKRD